MRFKRPILAGAMLFAMGCGLPTPMRGQSAPAQPRRVTPQDYRGVQTLVPGLFVTPIPNAAFTAKISIVSHEKLADGSEHVTQTSANIGRSSTGRIFNERHAMVPATFQGEPRLLSTLIYDPDTRVSTILNPMTRMARQQVLPNPPATSGIAHRVPSGPGVQETQLGSQMRGDTELHGLRKSRTIPAEQSGTGKPVVVVDDYWYSSDLGIDLVIRHEDPRTGEQIVAVTEIERTNPDPEKLRIPEGYKVVDETPPPPQRAAAKIQ